MSYRLNIRCPFCDYAFDIQFRDVQWGYVGSEYTCPNCEHDCEAT